MHQALDGVEPPWIAEAIDQLLPDGIDVRGIYYSWTEQARFPNRGGTVFAVILSSSQLLGFEWSNEGSGYQLQAVPRFAVGRVTRSLTARLDDGGEFTVQEGSFHLIVELSAELSPFGGAFELPITKDDYFGDRNRASDAARQFADALSATIS